MANISLDLCLPYKKSKSLIKSFIEQQEPIMNWGPPGIGKSDMIQEIGKELNRPVIDIRLSLYGSEDIKGYPYINQETGNMHFAMTNEFPQDPDSNAIIFFDEINAAMQSTQLAMYQLILNRRVGEYELPKGVSVVAAGNRETDKAGLSEMPKPLQNRFAHVETQHSFNDWLDWAIQNEVHRDIIGFLSKFQDKLFQFDPKTSSRGFPTPRSWAKTSKMLKANPNISDEEVQYIVSSCVGTVSAGEFQMFRELLVHLPEAQDIFEGKAKKLELEDPSLHYALITNLLYSLKDRLGKVDQSEWDKYANNFLQYLIDCKDNIGPEFVAMALGVGYGSYKLPFNAKRIPNMKEIVREHGAIFSTINNANA